ncbi:hypothetical protein QNH99_09190 [Pantoea allii]|uniref:hypothetical protein n=1 Tax=Pantoea allii TaxID=574096 RepID=UPI00397731A3
MEKVIFSGFGMFITQQNEEYYINYDEGGVVNKDVKCKVSPEEAFKAQQSAQDAYEVMLLTQNRKKLNHK